MAQFKGVRKLSQKKYDEMKKAGTLDAGIVYVTPTKTLPVLQGTAEPTTELIGEVGQFYLDTVNKKLYQCVNVVKDETAGTVTYEWQGVGGVSQEDFDKLVNNEITLNVKASNNSFKQGNALGVGSYGIAIGKMAYGGEKSVAIGSGTGVSSNTQTTKNGIAVGYLAQALDNGVSIGYNAQGRENNAVVIGKDAGGGLNSVVIGTNASADEYDNCVLLGNYAKSKANNTIQLGTGTNSTEKTLQIYTDNVYNFDTHTLTVQNIEQNGNKVLGILQGTTVPDTSTVGELTQFYLDTTTKKLYQCVEVDTETPSYTWKEIGASSGGGSGRTKIYSGGESFAVGSTFTFNQNVGSYSTIELVLRNNGYNSTEYVKLQVVPSGSNCMIHIPEYSDSVLNQVNLSFTENTMTVNNSLIDLSDYDSWQLLKVYLIED